MVRSQRGTWFNANHIKTFYVKNSKGVFEIWGRSEGDFNDMCLGIFDSEEEAQAELDSLFGEDEARS